VLSIVSFHTFDGTPTKDEMVDIFVKCREKGDIGKVAVMARSPGDVLDLLEATLEAPKPVCAISMGPIGMHSRIVAPVYGSMLTYGYVRKPVAPGQMRVDKIIEGLKLLGLRFT
jgi:3-dehydroquinate dehydratase-1